MAYKTHFSSRSLSLLVEILASLLAFVYVYILARFSLRMRRLLLVQSSSIVARAYHSKLFGNGMHAELEYVSLGCNRTPHAADWSSTGLLAYGASQSVALAEETEVSSGLNHSSQYYPVRAQCLSCTR